MNPPAKRLARIAGAALVLLILLVVWNSRRINTWPITNPYPSGETLIAFGDSLTYGRGASQGHALPDVLSELIGKPIRNRGVNGNTSEDALKRLDSEILSENPRVVIVLLGGNDMMQRVPADRQFENLRQIVERIQAEGALVVLVGLKEIGVFTEGGYAERYEQLARETGAVLVPHIMRGIMFRRELMSDQVHPNDEGYRLMAEKIERVAGEYLRR